MGTLLGFINGPEPRSRVDDKKVVRELEGGEREKGKKERHGTQAQGLGHILAEMQAYILER